MPRSGLLSSLAAAARIPAGPWGRPTPEPSRWSCTGGWDRRRRAPYRQGKRSYPCILGSRVIIRDRETADRQGVPGPEEPLLRRVERAPVLAPPFLPIAAEGEILPRQIG